MKPLKKEFFVSLIGSAIGVLIVSVACNVFFEQTPQDAIRLLTRSGYFMEEREVKTDCQVSWWEAGKNNMYTHTEYRHFDSKVEASKLYLQKKNENSSTDISCEKKEFKKLVFAEVEQ